MTVYKVLEEITGALQRWLKSCIRDDEVGLLENCLVVKIVNPSVKRQMWNYKSGESAAFWSDGTAMRAALCCVVPHFGGSFNSNENQAHAAAALWTACLYPVWRELKVTDINNGNIMILYYTNCMWDVSLLLHCHSRDAEKRGNMSANSQKTKRGIKPKAYLRITAGITDMWARQRVVCRT